MVNRPSLKKAQNNFKYMLSFIFSALLIVYFSFTFPKFNFLNIAKSLTVSVTPKLMYMASPMDNWRWAAKKASAPAMEAAA